MLTPTYIILNHEDGQQFDYKRFPSAKEAIFYFIASFADRFEDTPSSIGYILRHLTVENEDVMKKRLDKRRATLQKGCDLIKTNWNAARKYWFALDMYEDFDDYVYEIEDFETESYEMWLNRYEMISQLEKEDLVLEPSFTIICSHRNEESPHYVSRHEIDDKETYGRRVIDSYYTQIKHNIDNGLPINEKLPDYVEGAQHVLFR